jgi:hypothetical protein
VGVDTKVRAELAQLVRQLISGQLRTRDYDDRVWELPADDPAVGAIRSRLWFLYSDVRNVRFDLERVPTVSRGAIDRSLAFLSTELPYRYRRKSFITSIGWFRWIPAIARRLAAEAAEGDPDAWPFFHRGEWEEYCRRRA